MRTLYYVNGSIPSWRVMLSLHEKGLAFEGRRMHVMRTPRPTREPAFLALNPRGMTPVLVEDDGATMNESLAILTYLELRYPAPPLLPAEPRELMQALSWAHEAEETARVYEPLELLFHHPAREVLGADQRASIQGALRGLRFELGLWEQRAAAATFIAGERFTVADCSFYPVLAYMMRRGLSLGSSPALAAYELRVRARPAAVASFPVGWEHEVGKANLFRLAREVVGAADE